MVTIYEQDIAEAEILFLPKDEKFSEEKREIIKCLVSKDIIACPGSGKTTTLLAKLSIIEKSLPFSGNQGVCVLTHTNVAIDEIKDRLGAKSNKLFEYPNFFGTIQTFVNKFLAIPYFQNKCGKNIVSIDDEIYHIELLRDYYLLQYRIRYALEKKFGAHVLDKIKNMRFDYQGDFLIDRNTSKPLFVKECDTSKALKNLKKGVMEKGIICYDDAYWLAYQYLNKCDHHLLNFISNRFSFLFLDEMQDTSRLQLNLLNKLFDKHRVIIQRFGDPNQSIFEKTTDMAWDIWSEQLCITDSKRNSTVISNIISPFEFSPSGMKGNENLLNISPKIIVFNDNNISNVLPMFSKLIIDSNLHTVSKNIFKAVGRVAKQNEDGKIKIPSYYPSFNSKKTKEIKPRYLSDFIIKEKFDPLNDKDVRFYRNTIMNALLKVLWIYKIKKDETSYFTVKSLLKGIQKADETLYLQLVENLHSWCLKLKKGQDIKQEFMDYCNELLGKLFNITDLSNLSDFYQSNRIMDVSLAETINSYTHVIDEENDLQINIDTIAGVKGETHTGTLFLETFFYKYDVCSLIDYFKGIMKPKNALRIQSASKHVYVAMSRPTHLLCIAAQKTSIQGHEEELCSMGWELVYVD